MYVMPSLIYLCWGFTAQSTQWGHIERGCYQWKHGTILWAVIMCPTLEVQYVKSEVTMTSPTTPYPPIHVLTIFYGIEKHI